MHLPDALNGDLLLLIIHDINTKKIDGLHPLRLGMLILGGIRLVPRLVMTPIERHRTLNTVDENMIDGIMDQGHSIGSFICCVNWYSHGDNSY